MINRYSQLALLLSFGLGACTAGGSGDDSDSTRGDDDEITSLTGGNAGDGDGDDFDLGTGGNGSITEYKLPDGYTKADLGGFKLGSEITSGAGMGITGCGNEILAVVRDFRRGDPSQPDPGDPGHPDFQTFYGPAETTGLVNALLVDQKPVYSGTGHLGDKPQKQMTSADDFLDWYTTDVTGTVNRTYELYLSLEPNNGVRTFQSNAFYPLNGAGFGSEPPFAVNEGLPDEQIFPEQNFHFTTEVHTKFRYNGGEVFSFSGDDDLWVFINGHLALDLGGLHPEVAGSIDLDTSKATLEIVAGGEYTLDLFHAERGMPESNFRIDSTLEFTECGVVVK